MVMKLECSQLSLLLLHYVSLSPLAAADCKSLRHRTNHVKEGSDKIGLLESKRREGGRQGANWRNLFSLLLSFPIGVAAVV